MKGEKNEISLRHLKLTIIGHPAKLKRRFAGGPMMVSFKSIEAQR